MTWFIRHVGWGVVRLRIAWFALRSQRPGHAWLAICSPRVHIEQAWRRYRHG